MLVFLFSCPPYGYGMHLLLDIDQTLYPLLRAIATLPGGEEVREEHCKTWHSLEDMCLRPAPELIEEAIQPEVALQVGLYPGAREVVLGLAEENIDIALATHREKRYRDVTVEFLTGVGLGDFPLYVGEGIQKESLPFSDGLLVDDSPYVIRDACQKGIAVSSLQHLYNKDVAEQYGVRRGRDWDELGLISREILFD